MRLALIGAVCGLAWAAGLRSYMTEVAGLESTVTWVGTMAAILAPGVAVGGLLGSAEHLRRSGGPRGWRWLALSPLLLASAPLAMPVSLGSVGGHWDRRRGCYGLFRAVAGETCQPRQGEGAAGPAGSPLRVWAL